jgi:hypothetical protein
MNNRKPRLLAAAGLAATVAAGVAGLAYAAGYHGSPSAAQYQYGKHGGKVTICHHTHSKKHPMVTITVGAAAVKAHQRHGDTLGACPPAAPTTTHRSGSHGHGHGDAQGQSGSSESQGGGHGHGGGQGHGHGHGRS